MTIRTALEPVSIQLGTTQKPSRERLVPRRGKPPFLPSKWDSVTAMVLLFLGALYLGSVPRVPPDAGYAGPDLQLLHQWRLTGHLDPLEHHPEHLLKPGYILYLRLLLGSSEPFPLRRVLLGDALAVIVACVAVCVALSLTGRKRAGAITALCFLAYTPLRDAADHVLSETIATAGLLFCLAVFVFGLDRRWHFIFLAGVLAGLFAVIRPNVFVSFAALALVVLAMDPSRRRFAPAFLAAFFSGCLTSAALGTLGHVPLNPLGVRSSSAILWGTADYYWLPDIGTWPVTSSGGVDKTRELRLAAHRWHTKLSHWTPDRRRALWWTLGHSWFSAEELPARWRGPLPYRWYDRGIRRWWWAIALCLVGLASGTAVNGRGCWRLAPLAVVVVILGQGVLFGADPRFSLPFVPLLFVLLALSLEGEAIGARSVVAGVASLACGFVLIAAAPDMTNSDYGILRAGQALAVHIPTRLFEHADHIATVHVRILEETQHLDRGVDIWIAGQPVAEYKPTGLPQENGFLTARLSGPLLGIAKRTGVTLSVLPRGGSGAFLYFPVISWPWGTRVTIDHSAVFESGYGGEASGGIPYWVHSGDD